MAKRKCKPVDQWTQLHLWPDSELEIEQRTFIQEMRELPYWKDWQPIQFRAGVTVE